MVPWIQSKNHAANKGKSAGRYQFDTHPTEIGLKSRLLIVLSIPKNSIFIGFSAFYIFFIIEMMASLVENILIPDSIQFDRNTTNNKLKGSQMNGD